MSGESSRKQTLPHSLQTCDSSLICFKGNCVEESYYVNVLTKKVANELKNA